MFSGPVAERPSAVACWSETSAYGLLNRLTAKGHRLPEEAAIIGYDGIDFPAPLLQRVTSIRAPWREVGRSAVSLLASLIEGRDTPRQMVLPVELAPGNTT
jgi:DNA-binding LacI/PurR family transcriptional regulator